MTNRKPRIKEIKQPTEIIELFDVGEIVNDSRYWNVWGTWWGGVTVQVVNFRILFSMDVGVIVPPYYLSFGEQSSLTNSQILINTFIWNY